MTQHVREVLPLGFGRCKLQVQVPEESDVKTVEDLAGKRIATSFEVVAGGFFDEVDRRVREGGRELSEGGTKIEYVGGSVEASCALGLSDGIGAVFLSVFLSDCCRSDALSSLSALAQSILSVRSLSYFPLL